MRPASIILFITWDDLLTNYTCVAAGSKREHQRGAGVKCGPQGCPDHVHCLPVKPRHLHTSKNKLSDLSAKALEREWRGKGEQWLACLNLFSSLKTSDLTAYSTNPRVYPRAPASFLCTWSPAGSRDFWVKAQRSHDFSKMMGITWPSSPFFPCIQ